MPRYKIEQENELMRKQEMEFFLFPVEPNHEGACEHVHDIIELLFIIKGRFEITCDSRTISAKEGDMVLFRSNTVHRTEAKNDAENSYWVLKIAPRLLINFLPKNKASDSLLWFSINRHNSKSLWTKEEIADSPITEGLAKLIAESKNPDGNTELAMRIAVATVVLGLLRLRENEGEQSLDNSTIGELIYRSIVYVNNNYAYPITAEEVSRELNVSYSYFSRSFKRITGVTFRQHLNSVRINHGESLLRNTQYSVSKISELCGFESVSHFISTYKKLKNTSPLKSRKA